MHCVAALEPAGADALTGADATAPFEPSIVAVAISPATSPSTVFARLSAWTWDMMGVAGGVVLLFKARAPQGRGAGGSRGGEDGGKGLLGFSPKKKGGAGRGFSAGLLGARATTSLIR